MRMELLPISIAAYLGIRIDVSGIHASFATGRLEVRIPTGGTRLYCGAESTVETIQVLLDAKLLKATNLAAKKHRVNRSALIRRALMEHLKRLRKLESEERDRQGYLAQPQRVDEYRVW